mmetsp:Transcript_10623/g.23395  ORF Transcript_10623/g.23395 Transcript_10623/m.23395 type:complete len:215 (-) Transcript_10623:34-678(-)
MSSTSSLYYIPTKRQRSQKALSHINNSNIRGVIGHRWPSKINQTKRVDTAKNPSQTTIDEEDAENCEQYRYEIKENDSFQRSRSIPLNRGRRRSTISNCVRSRSLTPQRVADPSGRCTTQWILKKKRICKVEKAKLTWVSPPCLELEERDQENDDVMNIFFKPFLDIFLGQDRRDELELISVEQRQKAVNFMYKIDERSNESASFFSLEPSFAN